MTCQRPDNPESQLPSPPQNWQPAPIHMSLADCPLLLLSFSAPFHFLPLLNHFMLQHLIHLKSINSKFVIN